MSRKRWRWRHIEASKFFCGSAQARLGGYPKGHWPFGLRAAEQLLKTKALLVSVTKEARYADNNIGKNHHGLAEASSDLGVSGYRGPGFDASILSEFRTRLIQGEAEHLLLQ